MKRQDPLPNTDTLTAKKKDESAVLAYGKKLHRYELLLYGAVWTIVFLSPFLIALYDYLSLQSPGTSFNMSQVLSAWRDMIPFFILFAVHNFFVSPFFFKKGSLKIYLLLSCVLLVLFGVWISYNAPGRQGRFPMEGPPPFGMEEGGMPPRHAMEPPQGGHGPRDIRPMEGDTTLFMAPGGHMGEPRPSPSGGQRLHQDGGEAFRPGGPMDREPRMKPFGLELMKFMLAILMMLVNLGVKYFFRSLLGERRMAQLEKENLNQQLEYLRYQINPHFFMNTLNNIHALVDIDQEQAKSSILELSRLMRYILYEGDKPTIPLSVETDFLGHYISLMRIRFSEGVKIELDVPEECAGVEIPPLLFVSYVENAFKHGVSYDTDSFVRVSISLDGGKLFFRCENSVQEGKGPKGATPTEGGVGQENVKRRLDLLYGTRYTLHIDSKPNTYEVLLVIPVNGLSPQKDAPADDN